MGGLWQLLDGLEDVVLTDLTHAFHPGIPHHPAVPDEVRVHLVDFDSPYRARMTQHQLVGQWGTHVDAPFHFDRSGRALDEIPAEEMLLRLVVLDVRVSVDQDPDYAATVADALAWEERHGPIPARALVALRTGWHTRWDDPAAFANVGADGVAHRPGWSLELLRFLIDERDVAAIGHETPDTDPARTGRFDLERLWLESGRWQVELLARLDRLPEHGALIAVSWPKARGAAGFPARAIGLHRCHPSKTAEPS